MVVHIRNAADLVKAVGEVFAACVSTDLKGKNVFVKPNMLRPARPEECVITDPALVEAVVTVLQKMGARCTVGDNPIPQRLNETQVAEKCGYLSASRATFKAIGSKNRAVKINRVKVPEILLSSDILDCDFLVSLPKFKTHMLTTLSIAVKNHFGAVPGGLKPYLHSLCSTIDEFSELLVDIYELRPPDLVIADCLRIHDGKGRSFRPEQIIASNNGHALDYVCSQMAGIAAVACPTLRAAISRGLLDPGMIKTEGDLRTIAGFAMPFDFPFKNILAGAGQRVWSRGQRRLVPAIDLNKCTRCGECERICPGKVIQGQKIDYRGCIRCYCCMEVCPVGAIRRRLRM